MLKAVLFDFDGTVGDTIECVITCMDRATKALGVDFPLAESRAMIGTPLFVIGEKLIGPGWGQRFMDSFLEFYPQCSEGHIRAYPKIPEILAMLREKQIKVCLVTSKRRSFLIENLKQIGCYGFIDEMVPLEEHEQPKPHPAPVLTALRKLGIKPDETIMVGDTHFDIECAHGAGVQGIGVSWGGGSRESIVAAKPEYMADTGEELQRILAGLIC